MFIDLPAIKPQLEAYIAAAAAAGGWSSNAMQITQAWMRDGLKQRCITRDLKWGVPVPIESMKQKVGRGLVTKNVSLLRGTDDLRDGPYTSCGAFLVAIIIETPRGKERVSSPHGVSVSPLRGRDEARRTSCGFGGLASEPQPLTGERPAPFRTLSCAPVTTA